MSVDIFMPMTDIKIAGTLIVTENNLNAMMNNVNIVYNTKINIVEEENKI